MVDTGAAKKRRITRRHLSAMPAPLRDSRPLLALAPLFDNITGRMGVGFSMSEQGKDVYVSGRYSRLMAQGQEPLLEDTIDLRFGESSVQLRLLSLEQDERLTHLMAMAMIGEVAGGLAHDFRNAMGVVKMNIPALCDAARYGSDDDGRGVDEIVGEINTAIDFAADMCGRVQTIGLRSMERMLVVDNLKTIVDSVVSILNFKLKQAAIDGRSISIESSITDPLYAKMVSSEVYMAVMNILYNATRYCGLDNKEGIITIFGYRNREQVVLSIGNNGPPIAEEIRDTLLKKPLTTACVHGYGLYTAASRLRTFGGDLTFRTSSERTVFRITLEAAEEEDCVKRNRMLNYLKK